MTPRDTVNLLTLVAHLCPAMRIEERTAEGWHLALGDLAPEDCVAAVRQLAREKPFIAPSDIAQRVEQIRTERLRTANLIYEPEPGETVIDFQARLRAKQAAAAAGQLPPTRPVLALPPGTSAPMPDVLGHVLDAYRDERNPPALRVRCPFCGSRPGQWCERWKRRQKVSVVGFLHPSRKDAAAVGAQ
jgi:hypothetical protein